MKRKLLSLVLAFAMTAGLLTVGAGAAGPAYGDTVGHWAEGSIGRWSGHGIIQGNNGKFRPNGQLTCAQFAAILARLLKLPAAENAGFADNNTQDWFFAAINRCAAAGILNGNGDGTVTPNAPIARERAMVILGRAMGIEPIENPNLTQFTDADEIDADAEDAVRWAYASDLLTEKDGKLRVQEELSRKELSRMLEDFLALSSAD